MNSTVNTKIQGSIYKMEKLRHDVIFIEMTKKEVMSLKTLKELLSDIESLSNNQPFHSFTNITKSSSEMNPDARDYLKKYQVKEKLNLSQVFIFESFSKAFLVGIYLKLMNQTIPTKSVSSLSKAFEWADNFNKKRRMS